MKSSLLWVFILLMFSACATREELERRELLRNLSDEVKNGQRSSSESVGKLQELEERMDKLSGTIEENAHHREQGTKKEIEALKNTLKMMKEEFEAFKLSLTEKFSSTEKKVDERLSEQQKYLEQIISSLEKLGQSGVKAKKGKKNTKDDNKEDVSEATPATSPYDSAMALYKQGKFSEARDQLAPLLEDKHTKGTQLAKVIHNLGMSEFNLGNFDVSAAYFGRLYTDFSSSSLNSTGLLYLGKALNKLGKKEEAKQAWLELTTKFTKSKSALEAKKLLEKI